MLPIDQDQCLSSNRQYGLFSTSAEALCPVRGALNKVHFHFQPRTDLTLSLSSGEDSLRWAWRWQTIWKGKKRYLCQFAGRARGSETLPNRGAVIFQAILIEFFKNSIESTKISVQDLFITPTNIQGDPSRP